MNRSNPIVLVCTADDSFAMAIAVTVTSLVLNSPQSSVVLYLIDAGISDSNRSRIEQTFERYPVQLNWVQPEARRFRDVPLSGHISVASYYRLLIADWLPKAVERVIYLDGDMVVLDDLQTIWSLGPSASVLRAVPDQNITSISEPMGLVNFEELGIPRHNKYFNAGLLDINLVQWRSQGITARVMDYLEHNAQSIRWHDQDVLNAILFDQWIELPARWNRPITFHRFLSWEESPYSQAQFESLLENPAVVHYVESGKPWTPGFKHPERHLFFRYLAKTAWSCRRVEGKLWIARLVSKMRRLFQVPSLVQKKCLI